MSTVNGVKGGVDINAVDKGARALSTELTLPGELIAKTTTVTPHDTTLRVTKQLLKELILLWSIHSSVTRRADRKDKSADFTLSNNGGHNTCTNCATSFTNSKPHSPFYGNRLNKFNYHFNTISRNYHFSFATVIFSK